MNAEHQVLGCILRANKVYELAREIITGDDFANPTLGAIFDGIGRHLAAGGSVDAYTLENHFPAWEIRNVGADEPWRWIDAGEYPETVAEAATAVRVSALRRRGRDALTSALEDLRDSGREPSQVLQRVAEFAASALTAASDVDREAAEVEAYARDIRLREAAREKVRRETEIVVGIPAPTRLDDLLAEPDEAATYRVDGLMPTGGNIVLAAQYKAGKSTAVGNLARCLVDGEPFLGAFATEQAVDVVIIDNELDVRMLRRWLREYGIRNTDRVRVVPLRGRTALFDILDPAVRAEWARSIGPSAVLIFDCLRPVLDALGLSEDKDAGRFLVALDALKAEAGIEEAVVVHHMGHNGERSRGDSRILDWPDATWRIVREAEDPASPRYFSALGRDVDVHEGRLTYDAGTRALSYEGGSRQESREQGSTLRAIDTVVEFVRENPGASGEVIREGLKGLGFARSILTRARERAIETGAIEQRKRQGRGGGFTYFPSNPANPAETPPGGVPNPANPVYRAGLGLEMFENEPRPEVVA